MLVIVVDGGTNYIDVSNKVNFRDWDTSWTPCQWLNYSLKDE